MHQTHPVPSRAPVEEPLLLGMARAIFSIRWGLVPLYMGLYVAIVAYLYKFGQEIWHILAHLHAMTVDALLLKVLELIDITMVGNLVVMTAVGGYLIFVDATAFDWVPNKPRWLHHIDTTTQKVKMGMSLIGVSSIHLLRTFMEAERLGWDQVGKESIIHLIFCLTTLAYVVIGRLSHATTPPAHE